MNTRKLLIASATAALMGGFGSAALAQQSGTASGQEIQRGVPGVNVDLHDQAGPENNGVPGVNVDVGNPNKNNGVPGVNADVNTRSSGAGPENNGVPGVNADLHDKGAPGNNGVPGVNVDLHDQGAAKTTDTSNTMNATGTRTRAARATRH